VTWSTPASMRHQRRPTSSPTPGVCLIDVTRRIGHLSGACDQLLVLRAGPGDVLMFFSLYLGDSGPGAAQFCEDQ
jgi:hypothetical protein